MFWFLWQLCVNRSINILALHIAGELNIRTDKLSWLKESDHDYFLSSSMFSSLSKAISFPLKVDLFADRLNYKIPNYIYQHTDPYSSLVNSFSFKWIENVYLFPPIPLIDRVLNKFENDKVINGLIICPYWPYKPWYSKLLEMLIDHPLFFSDSCIRDSSQMLPRNCHFLGWPIGSVLAQRLEFQEKLLSVNSKVSLKVPWSGTRNIGEASEVEVVQRKLVRICLM